MMIALLHRLAFSSHVSDTAVLRAVRWETPMNCKLNCKVRVLDPVVTEREHKVGSETGDFSCTESNLSSRSPFSSAFHCIIDRIDASKVMSCVYSDYDRP